MKPTYLPPTRLQSVKNVLISTMDEATKYKEDENKITSAYARGLALGYELSLKVISDFEEEKC